MDELGDRRQFGHVRDALLQPVLDRLDVVIGRALDRLDARRIGEAERIADRCSVARAAAENAGTSAIACSSPSATSQAISTRTRARISRTR
jgi:hypothetical protein